MRTRIVHMDTLETVPRQMEFLPQNLAFEDAGIICCVNHIRDDKPERYPLGDCGCLLSSDNFHPDTGASPSISHAKASDDNFLSPDEVTASGQAAGHSESFFAKAKNHSSMDIVSDCLLLHTGTKPQQQIITALIQHPDSKC
ncbi:hypothetical protein CIHG_07896 [Coccidioides immitis H538.4]|uniref:Uncharacterized protein n=3 Tax=Coccidioides immitis TaxID=5501 RepID=A0A0J8R3T1_COCIT|nr:hypothetical protein CIRG_10110 [Coccidioides immitis RMSCC 2394]KMU79381.1 hypothetical protein CISG_07785 [Coccidioides immitis RMSCC 3703]KMU90086.1 hypothetical protein CIHG_07896 [Coccidioides immitis H538.4]